MRTSERHWAEIDPVEEAARAASAARHERALAAGQVHIGRHGAVVIDLTRELDRPSTDVPCPNCGGRLLVGDVNFRSRRADMACVSCTFRFWQDLQLEDEPRVGRPPRRLFRRHRSP